MNSKPRFVGGPLDGSEYKILDGESVPGQIVVSGEDYTQVHKYVAERAADDTVWYHYAGVLFDVGVSQCGPLY